MPSREDDNYQYDAGTASSDSLERYRLYDHGDDGWFEIIDTETGRSVQFKDGMIRSDEMNGIHIAREEDGDDIFDAVNKVLADAGSDTTIFVEPMDYRADGKDVTTTLETQAEGQRIDFLGSDVKMADGANVDPVHINNDSCTLANIVIDGNRDNNTHTRSVLVDSSNDTTVNNYEFLNTPIGLEANGSRACTFANINTNQNIPDEDVFIKVVNSENMSLRDGSLTGFTNYGIWLQNSEDLLVDSMVVTTDPNGQSVANAGVYVEGTIQSRIGGSIESFGDVADAILAEPFDVGGTNERAPTQNTYDFKIEGAQDVGVHLSDCDAEIVDAVIDGETGGTRTQQAFLVDSPYGIDDTPGHTINLKAQKCDRVTDTLIGSNNAGMQIDGHFQQMSNTSTIQSNGTGIFTPSFGPAMPSPAFNIESATSVEAQVDARRGTTDNNGQIDIDWSDFFAFTDKPVLSVQLENPGSWYVLSYNTDANGRYTSATVQVTNSDGTAAANGENVLALLQGT